MGEREARLILTGAEFAATQWAWSLLRTGKALLVLQIIFLRVLCHNTTQATPEMVRIIRAGARNRSTEVTQIVG